MNLVTLYSRFLFCLEKNTYNSITETFPSYLNITVFIQLSVHPFTFPLSIFGDVNLVEFYTESKVRVKFLWSWKDGNEIPITNMFLFGILIRRRKIQPYTFRLTDDSELSPLLSKRVSSLETEVYTFWRQKWIVGTVRSWGVWTVSDTNSIAENVSFTDFEFFFSNLTESRSRSFSEL